MEAPPGVYIYLGYSKKDALILQRGRVKLGKRVPDTEEEERNEVKNTIQQTVSHFTSNANKVLKSVNFKSFRRQIKSILKLLMNFEPDFQTFLTSIIFYYSQRDTNQLVANKPIYSLHKHFPPGSIQGPSK